MAIGTQLVQYGLGKHSLKESYKQAVAEAVGRVASAAQRPYAGRPLIERLKINIEEEESYDYKTKILKDSLDAASLHNQFRLMQRDTLSKQTIGDMISLLGSNIKEAIWAQYSGLKNIFGGMILGPESLIETGTRFKISELVWENIKQMDAGNPWKYSIGEIARGFGLSYTQVEGVVLEILYRYSIERKNLKLHDNTDTDTISLYMKYFPHDAELEHYTAVLSPTVYLFTSGDESKKSANLVKLFELANNFLFSSKIPYEVLRKEDAGTEAIAQKYGIESYPAIAVGKDFQIKSDPSDLSFFTLYYDQAGGEKDGDFEIQEGETLDRIVHTLAQQLEKIMNAECFNVEVSGFGIPAKLTTEDLARMAIDAATMDIDIRWTTAKEQSRAVLDAARDMYGGRVPFERGLVDAIYSILKANFPEEAEYQLDKVMVVREWIKALNYILDQAWYSWGTTSGGVTPTLKYKINRHDSNSAKFVKHILNLLLIHKDLIVQAHIQEETTLGAEFKKRTTSKYDYYSHSILGGMLGVKKQSFEHWIRKIKESVAQSSESKLNLKHKTFKNFENALRETLGINSLSEIYDLSKILYKKYYEKEFKKDFKVKYLSKILDNPNIDFREKLVSIIRAYISDPTISMTRLGTIIAQDKNLIVRPFIDISSLFKLLTHIYLVEKADVGISSDAKLKIMKRKCLDLVFDTMINNRLLTSDMRQDFELYFFTVLALTKSLRNEKERYTPINAKDLKKVLYTIMDLNKIIKYKDPLKVTHCLALRKLQQGSLLKSGQIRRLIKVLMEAYNKDPKNKEYCRRAIEHIKYYSDTKLHHRLALGTSINKRLETTIGYRIGDNYHDYFLKELLIPQQYEMLELTLGLDVYTPMFFENKISLYLSRHHLNRIKSFYTIFNKKDDGSIELVLVPINAYKHYHDLHGYHFGKDFRLFTIENELVKARVKHLYNLIQKDYIPGVDYHMKFGEAFAEETFIFNGREVHVWQDVISKDSTILTEWIERWIELKILQMKHGHDKGIELWMMKKYDQFYVNKYLKYMKDKVLFEKGDSKCQNPEFWEWYINTYKKENVYPPSI